ncbi:hypothetical protein SAMN04488550_1468 [Gordonia malaquae]|uniref:hypothetical protein n=1 Tax=Gordonia malaquae TaxID=410332 RepID=UPI00058E7724|nr:hypothetical protein [Gordonia malaquae]SEC20170.1 hypothetical protein SAMN04488550_1468 [Gordonia malaquae]
MSTTSSISPRTVAGAVLAGAASLALLTACGDDSSSDESPTSGMTQPMSSTMMMPPMSSDPKMSPEMTSPEMSPQVTSPAMTPGMTMDH